MQDMTNHQTSGFEEATRQPTDMTNEDWSCTLYNRAGQRSPLTKTIQRGVTRRWPGARPEGQD